MALLLLVFPTKTKTRQVKTITHTTNFRSMMIKTNEIHIKEKEGNWTMNKIHSLYNAPPVVLVVNNHQHFATDNSYRRRKVKLTVTYRAHT